MQTLHGSPVAYHVRAPPPIPLSVYYVMLTEYGRVRYTIRMRNFVYRHLAAFLTPLCVLLCALALVVAPVAAQEPATVSAPAPAPAAKPVRGQDPMDPHPATTDIPPLAADYTLTARVADHAADGTVRVDGTERVMLTNTGTKPVDRATFNVPAAHYGWFALESGALDGAPATVDQADVRLSFPDWGSLAPKDTRVVSFQFHLVIGDAGDGYDGCRLDGDVLRLAYWFPMLSDDHGYPERIDPPYTATGDFHVTLSAPAGTVMAGTGVTQKQATTAGRTTWTVDAPKVRDWVAMLSPAYDVTRGTSAGGVAVEVYTIPAHYRATPGRVDAILADAITSLDKMSVWVGPYPYPVFHVVDAGLTMPGGIEFPTLITMGPRINDFATLVAHETAHQWFYGVIGTHPQDEPWVDEGAASYFEQAIYGGLGITPTLSRTLPCAVSATVWDTSISERDLLYCVYNGGRVTYAAIATAMGPAAFTAALHDLYANHVYGIISARDLLTTFQQHSAADLRPIVKPYLAYNWVDPLPPPGGTG